MATSGTYTFTVTRDQIISASLRALGVFGAGDTIPATDITNCSEALNLLVKNMVIDGLPLAQVQELLVTLIPGQATYTLGPTTAPTQPRPLRILDAFLRQANGTDTVLEVVSRYDYDTLGLKTTSGTPNQLFYNPQLTDGVITLFNVPDTALILHLIVQRQYQDFSASGNTPDFPQEAFLMLKWALADEISSEYGASPQIIQMCAMRAAQYRMAFFDFQQEYASVFFTPSDRGFS